MKMQHGICGEISSMHIFCSWCSVCRTRFRCRGAAESQILRGSVSEPQNTVLIQNCAGSVILWFFCVGAVFCIQNIGIFYNIWDIYQIYNPSPCQKDERCIFPSWKKSSHFQLIACTSSIEPVFELSEMNVLWEVEEFNIYESQTVNFTISLPRKTRNNGTLYLHLFLTCTNGIFKPLSDVFFDTRTTSHEVASLTRYMVQEPETVHLLSGEEKKKNLTTLNYKPIAHWKSQLSVYVMSEPFSISVKDITREIFPYIKLTNKLYLPMIYVNDISFTSEDLLALNFSSVSVPLTIVCSPITFGKLRMILMVQNYLKMRAYLGFKEKDTNEVQDLVLNTNVTLLLCTFFVASLHFLLDMLTFKSDISFWMKKKSMKGLSMNTIAWRCGCHIIIFLYLLDQGTSLIVLVFAGVATLVEVWKIKRAMKLTISWDRWKPKIEFGAITDEEKTTGIYDSLAMKYLSYILYPLCISGAVYSLLYIQHKSYH